MNQRKLDFIFSFSCYYTQQLTDNLRPIQGRAQEIDEDGDWIGVLRKQGKTCKCEGMFSCI